jgi:hypothetical protein
LPTNLLRNFVSFTAFFRKFLYVLTEKLAYMEDTPLTAYRLLTVLDKCRAEIDNAHDETARQEEEDTP